MKYQLVLQFPEDAMDFDGLVNFENTLISMVKEAVVDGHDIGSGEINFFILTDYPKHVFDNIFNLLDKKYRGILKAGYRNLNESKFKVLWPRNLKEFDVI